MAAVPRSAEKRAVLPFPGSGRLRGLTLRHSLPSGRALLLAFALLGAGALAYLGARETSLFALRTVQITGAPPRAAAHVGHALEPRRGISGLRLDRATNTTS